MLLASLYGLTSVQEHGAIQGAVLLLMVLRNCDPPAVQLKHFTAGGTLRKAIQNIGPLDHSWVIHLHLQPQGKDISLAMMAQLLASCPVFLPYLCIERWLVGDTSHRQPKWLSQKTKYTARRPCYIEGTPLKLVSQMLSRANVASSGQQLPRNCQYMYM